MSSCLITTLKETVSDNALLRLGDVKIHIYPSNTPAHIWEGDRSGSTITIVGDGHFTDYTGTANLGKTAVMETNVSGQLLYMSADKEYDIIISNKYALGKIYTLDVINASSPAGTFSGYIGFDLSDLLGVILNGGIRTGKANRITGDLKYIAPTVSNVVIGKNLADHSRGINGDISEFESNTALIRIDVFNQKEVTGSIAALANKPQLSSLVLENTGVTGNINSLSGNSMLTGIDVANTAVSGSLSSLAGLTQLNNLNVSGTSITGDTSDLASLTNLTTFNYTNTAITGTWPLT